MTLEDLEARANPEGRARSLSPNLLRLTAELDGQRNSPSAKEQTLTQPRRSRAVGPEILLSRGPPPSRLPSNGSTRNSGQSTCHRLAFSS